MTSEMWIILAVRVLGSLPVLRWPLAGAFIALLADLSDLFLRDWIDLGGVKDYQRFDKWLDQVYMLTFLAVALRWQDVPRNIAAALYAFRLAGFIAFEITGERGVLIFFPNVFEYWFIFVAALKQFGWEGTSPAPGQRLEARTSGIGSWPMAGAFVLFAIPYRYSRSQLAVAGAVILAAKLFHEYTLHVGQWFESFTATEALEAIWRFLTPPY